MAEHIHFVTGRLAEQSLREVVSKLADEVGFAWSVDVLPIGVAALMTPQLIAKRMRAPETADRVIIPGYCGGDLAIVETAAGIPVQKGPRDLHRLPEMFGRKVTRDESYGQFDIEIIAEINHAPRLERGEILRKAKQLRDEGADLIDVGCDPGATWSEVGDVVRMLVEAGMRVSVDSLNPKEIAPAVAAGAELVLSVNSSNREASPDWGCEVVAIPDSTESLESLESTAEFLDEHGVRYRLDPILAPIGAGFAASLGRYLETRRRWPESPMMMGVGNLTELSDGDSAGINLLLLGFCQEAGIHSVLTTQVINWARTSVRELDLARRLVKFAVDRGVPPKHLEPDLVMLRDPNTFEVGDEQLDRLAAGLKDLRDPNYRLFAERGEIHIVSGGIHLADADPFALFAKLMDANPGNLDASHSFYLGFEMAKALTAITLSKQYDQDNALNWGLLTREEDHHRLKRTSQARRGTSHDGPMDRTTQEPPE